MRSRNLGVALLALVLAAPADLPPAGAAAPLPASAQADPFAAARDLLNRGQAEQAAAAAHAALSGAPYSRQGYQLLYDAAGALGRPAEQLKWGKWLYWSHRYGGQAKEAEAVAARLAALYPEWNADDRLIDRWRQAVEEALKQATSEEQYRAAGHFMDLLLELNPADARLRREYDRLLLKAGEALSGGSFVAQKVRRKSPRWIAATNRQHQEWDKAFTRKTANYQVITNISYEFFETACFVMDEINQFYRSIYRYSKKTPLMTLAIHRKRLDFDKYCHEVLGQSLPLGVRGWFFDQKMTLAAYDHSGGYGDLTPLYRVLFHEASHQFVYLMCEVPAKEAPPTWLNEGTASYFEGCELKPDGTIVKNKPAALRVREWEYLEQSEQRHSLEDLISCEHRNYDGSYYSYGWSLVYFLLNYEEQDARVHQQAVTGAGAAAGPLVIRPGRLVYRQAYDKYLQFYTQKRRKDGETPLQLAQRLFVDEIQDPGVPDWEAFERRWRSFTQAVVQEVKSGPEFAEVLQARCRGYLEAGDFERALIAAEQADDKRPNDGESYRLLALANHGAGRPADAVYWLLRHWERAAAAEDWPAADLAEAWLAGNGAAKLVQSFCAATRAALRETQEVMKRGADGGHPVAAMLAGAHFMRATGLRPASLLGAIAELERQAGLDLRLWRLAFPEGVELNRVGDGGVDLVRSEPDGLLLHSPEGAPGTTLRCKVADLAWLEPPFEVRGSITADGREGAHLLLGIGPGGRPQAALAFEPGSRAVVTFYNLDLEHDRESGSSATAWNRLQRREVKDVENSLGFQLTAAGGGTLEIDGGQRLVFPEGWSSGRLTGAFAVAAGSDAVCLFSGVEIRSGQPFWPVEPAGDDQ